MASGTWKKAALVAFLGSAVACFFLFNLHTYLTLEHLKASRTELLRLIDAHPFTSAGVYFLAYVAITGLSLPGALPLTLLGGALFGFVTGTLLVSFASTMGATLACAASRFVLSDWVVKRLGDRMDTVNLGIKREGAFYLFAARLIPVIPFFAINLLMGLTAMPLRTFYLISQVGMLPGTMVFVNAGKELGRLTSLSGILSPGLLVSFALLGLFPFAAKKGVALYRRRTAKNRTLTD